jgi:glyoxylase-like metal-dependent hydrolase (beta-lactamase superfamily II)
MHQISRRSFLTATALAGAAFAMPAGAGAPLAGIQGPGVYRFKLGDYQITALFDGVWYLPIDDKFVRNASGAEVNQALAAAFLPPSILPISFTALMVNTGAKLVLIDAGTAGQVADTAGSMLDNLKVAGIDPKAIDTILISHFHPDHIDGIKSKDGAKIFPNAEILVPEPEWTFWMDDSNMGKAQGAVHRYFLNARRIF